MTMSSDNIKNYDTFDQIGRGGFANVYRGKNLKTGAEVAIKIINKNDMITGGFTKRVENEVNIHSRLKNPNIVELFSYFEDKNFIYLVMEMCRKGDLYKYMKNAQEPFNECQVRDFMTKIVEGLIYLHGHRILHRDLTLTNILLTSSMHVKIADFGLATQLNECDERHFTLCGTPNYISPEVASRSAHGLETDVWSLGCMLYTLLVGKPPFDTDAVKSTLNRVIIGDYEIPSTISSEAKDLIQSLLRKEPSERLKLDEILLHPFFTGTSLKRSQHDSTIDSGRYTFSSSNASRTHDSTMDRSSRYHTPISARDSSEQSRKVRAFLESVKEQDYSEFAPSFCDSALTSEHSSSVISGTGHRSHTKEGQARFSLQSSKPLTSTPSASDHLIHKLVHKRNDRKPVTSSDSSYIPGQYSKTSPCVKQAAVPDNTTANHLNKLQQRYRALLEKSEACKQQLPEKRKTTTSTEAVKTAYIPPPDEFASSTKSSILPSCDKIVKSSKIVEQSVPDRKSIQCHTSIQEFVQPFNSIRLRPIRQKTRNAIVNILDGGEVCLEFMKSRSPDAVVSEVVRITPDGTHISIYRILKDQAHLYTDAPAPMPASCSKYEYATLPRKYWKKYMYAARFITTVKSKTPKVTFFSELAKCMLMETGQDFEAVFYQGPKFSICADQVKVIDSSGMNITMETESESRLLSAEVQEMWLHVKKCKDHCLSLEKILESSESAFHSSTHFPVIIGSRWTVNSTEPVRDSSVPLHAQPSKQTSPSISPPTMCSFDGSLTSHATTVNHFHRNPCLPFVRRMSAEHHPQGSTASIILSPQSGATSRGSSQIIQRVYVDDIGWVNQLHNGTLWVYFDDGTQLAIHSHSTEIKFIDRNGSLSRYSNCDVLPDIVRSKLGLLDCSCHVILDALAT